MYVTIYVNSPYFDEISFKMNDYQIEERYSLEFREAERQANEIRELLTGVRERVREEVVAATTPKQAMTCPFCGASTTPDSSGRCEFCGGALGN